jgi:uncharacterized protein YqeY
MMAQLTEQITEAWKAAMRSGETQRKDVLSTLRAAIKKEEIDSRSGGESKELDDAGVMRVIEREAKKRRDAADEYDKFGRPERAEGERAELAILQEFLPAPLGDDELDEIVRAAIAQTGANGPAGMGKVIPVVMAQAAGRADGKRISTAVRKLLAG